MSDATNRAAMAVAYELDQVDPALRAWSYTASGGVDPRLRVDSHGAEDADADRPTGRRAS